MALSKSTRAKLSPAVAAMLATSYPQRRPVSAALQSPPGLAPVDMPLGVPAGPAAGAIPIPPRAAPPLKRAAVVKSKAKK